MHRLGVGKTRQLRKKYGDGPVQLAVAAASPSPSSAPTTTADA